jgi:glycosyltransferase involved in cell wall biosynthesis
MYVANSDAAAEMLKSRIGISPKRVSVIHSGLGDRWFETPTYRKKRNGPPRILLVGNNRAEKAYEDALEILSQTVGEEWVATIYSGRGDDLRQRVRRRGLEPRVVVVSGHQLTPADYDRADILLHAANSESYPRAVLEARARGLAIAATDVGDVRYLVEPEDLFNPGDVDRASSILRRHLTHEQVGPVRPRDESGLYSQTTVGTQLRHLIASLK